VVSNFTFQLVEGFGHGTRAAAAGHGNVILEFLQKWKAQRRVNGKESDRQASVSGASQIAGNLFIQSL